MGKTAKRLEPTITRDLAPQRTTCPHRDRPMRADYVNRDDEATAKNVDKKGERHRHAGCVELRQPAARVFLRRVADLHQPRHGRVGQDVNDTHGDSPSRVMG